MVLHRGHEARRQGRTSPVKSLFPAQEVCKTHLLQSLRTHGAAINASDTGTGKTLTTVELSRDLNRPVLVIAPKITLPAWRKAFAEQGLPVPDVLNWEKIRTGNTKFVTKTHKKNFKWAINPQTLVIFDESHVAKNPASINAALMTTAKDQGHYVLALSATAAKNPCDMYALGYVLGLHKGRDFVTWATRWGCKFNHFRRLYFPVGARARLTELNALLYPNLGYKVTREDLKEFFSVTRINTEPLDLGNTDEISALYDTMETELAEIDAMASKDKGSSALTARLRARQTVEMLKLPAISAMVKDYLDQDFSVAVFLNFSGSIDALDTMLGGGHPRIEGVTTTQDRLLRDQAMDSFQSNLARVVLCNISAGGVGINLHDTSGDHPRVAIISPNDNAEQLVQVLGRVDRAGAKSDTIQHVVFAAGTVEEEVEKNVRKKLIELGLLHATNR